MKNRRESKIRFLGVAAFVLICQFVCHSAIAEVAWADDYIGSLGTKQIGLMVTYYSRVPGKFDENTTVLNAHYYYKAYLKDIELKLLKRDALKMSFQEYDDKGNVNGHLNLDFEKEGHITGEWRSADGNKAYPVSLHQVDGVSGTPDGGRCGLSKKDYDVAQEKIRQFYLAAKNNDVDTLRKNFNFTKPLTKAMIKAIAQSTPHDMFCNYQGIMLDGGVVWFNTDGSPIVRR